MMANVFGVLLFVAGLFQALGAFLATAKAENVMQQIYGGVGGLTAALLIVGGSILMTIGRNGLLLDRFRTEMLAAAKGMEALNETLAKQTAGPQPFIAGKAKDCQKCGHNNPPGTAICRCGNPLYS